MGDMTGFRDQVAVSEAAVPGALQCHVGIRRNEDWEQC